MSKRDEILHMKRIASSPFWSCIYFALGFVAYKICMIIPYDCRLFMALLPYAGIYCYSESLKDWRDGYAGLESD